MNDFGNLLYAGKTDSKKDGVVFIFVGIFLFIVSNFIYAKMIVIIFGVLCALLGLYLLIFKRGEKISIYENAIVLTIKGQEFLFPKEQIVQIEYEKIKVRRSPVVSYYPVLILNNHNKVLINKAFNSVINQDFRKVIESYI